MEGRFVAEVLTLHYLCIQDDTVLAGSSRCNTHFDMRSRQRNMAIARHSARAGIHVVLLFSGFRICSHLMREVSVPLLYH